MNKRDVDACNAITALHTFYAGLLAANAEENAKLKQANEMLAKRTVELTTTIQTCKTKAWDAVGKIGERVHSEQEKVLVEIAAIPLKL